MICVNAWCTAQLKSQSDCTPRRGRSLFALFRGRFTIPHWLECWLRCKHCSDWLNSVTSMRVPSKPVRAYCPVLHTVEINSPLGLAVVSLIVHPSRRNCLQIVITPHESDTIVFDIKGRINTRQARDLAQVFPTFASLSMSFIPHLTRTVYSASQMMVKSILH